MVVIAVTDTGEGIASENMDRVFDPDFTTTARPRPGAGGWDWDSLPRRTWCNRVAAPISVRSELGKGTTLIIRLPGDARIG